MIKLKYFQMLNEKFNAALGKLNDSGDLEADTCLSLIQITKSISSFIADAGKIEKKFLDQCAEKDTKGGYKYTDKKKKRVKLKKSKIESYNKSYKDLMNLECKIDVNKIEFNLIKLAKLSTNEIMAVEPLLTMPKEKVKKQIKKKISTKKNIKSRTKKKAKK